MAINGKYVVICLRTPGTSGIGIPIAGVTSDRLRVSGETIEKASATSSKWKEFLAGRMDWGINSDYLITDWNSIANNAMKVGKTYAVMVIDSNNTDEYLSGTVICTECVIDMRNGSLVKGSFSFQGTGPLVSEIEQ